MNPTPRQAVTADTIVDHADFVRALARALVSDPNHADDVAQETLVTALETPPREAPAMRRWLRSVARNVVRQTHRSDASRAARERRRVPPASPDDPHDIAQHRETMRDLVDTLLEVREPYQTAIFLRYYENLPPRRIAARLGVPVDTVKTRLKRGLRELRARMDAANEGDRNVWLSALVGLLGLPTGATIAPPRTTGGEPMTTPLVKLILGVMIVASTTTAVLFAIGIGTSKSPDTTPPEAFVTADVEIDGELGAGVGGEAADSEGFFIEDAAADERGGMRIATVDESGVQVPHAQVYRVDTDDKWTKLGETDDYGLLDARETHDPFTLVARADGYAVESMRVDPADVDAPELAMVLRRGAVIEGVVRFDDGTSARAGIRVYACREGGCLTAYDLQRSIDHPGVNIVKTDTSGRFVVPGLLDGERYRLVAGADGIGTLEAPTFKDPRRPWDPLPAGAIAGGDDVEIIVGYLYGAAARLVETDGSPLRVSARVDEETATEVIYGIGGGGGGGGREAKRAPVVRITHNDPTLALAGVDVAPFHPKRPVPKHVMSRFYVNAENVKGMQMSYWAWAVGYVDAEWKYVALPMTGAIEWTDVVMTPQEELDVGSLDVDLRLPGELASEFRRQSSSLGEIVLEESDHRAITVGLVGGETSAKLEGIPAGFYHARFRGISEMAFVPEHGSPGIPIEIGPGPSKLEIDLEGLGSMRVHIVEPNGREYDRAATLRVEPLGSRRSFGLFERHGAPYLIPALAPGGYRIRAWIRDSGEREIEVVESTVFASDVTDVTIEIPVVRRQPTESVGVFSDE